MPDDTCMARRISHHMGHLDRHPGGQEQAIAIAASECGVAKNASDGEYAKMACFERQNVGTFEADKIKIKGGDYRWTNTRDGYFTVHDVPLISECPKGTKDAPYDVTKDVLEEFVATAQSRYNDGRFCATAFKGHNPDIPISHPDFCGFVLPNRVGKYALESGEKWTIFGDIKLTAAKFEEAKAGKLPYLSPEVPWPRRRIRGLSFLDTLPPYHEYALFTLGEETEGQAAKFDVSSESAAKFMDPSEDDDMEKVAKYLEEQLPKMLAKYMAEEMPKAIAKHLSPGAGAVDPVTHKPSALPVEPDKGGKMTLDPEFAAKFTAQTNEIADIKARLAERDNADKSKAFVEKAKAKLAKKSVSDDLLAQIGAFAAEAVTKKDGEAWFDKFVEALAPSLREKPPASLAEFQAAGGATVDAGDPIVAKFAAEGPDALQAVGKFAAQWRGIKDSPGGEHFQTPQEEFIKLQLAYWKAERNGTLPQAENRR